MPSLLLRLLLVLLLLCQGAAWAGTLTLDDATEAFQVKGELLVWLDGSGQASIESVAANPANFAATSALGWFDLDRNKTLWLKLRLVRPVGNRLSWTLNVPVPSMDAVALYQPDGLGGWSVQHAGDTLPQAEWHKGGLYPDFALRLPTGVAQEVYLQVRNYKPTGVPIRLFNIQQNEAQRQLELLTVALMLGSLLSLAVLSFIRYLEHLNRLDALASVFGLLIAASIAQLNGVLNNFVWFAAPKIANYASGVMPMLVLGCAVLFVRNFYALATHHERFGGFLSFIGWGMVAAVLGFGLAERFVTEWLASVLMLLAALIGLFFSVLIWHSGNPFGRWLLATMVPHCLCALYMAVETTGLVPVIWEMRYVTSLCISVAVPILLYILSQFTHGRKQLVLRANCLPTQDALTGLLKAEVFQTYLEEAIDRAITTREPIALALVEVVNHEHIRQALGDTTAEHCLLRAVVKVQRILRDVDPAGRVGTAQFALLMDGLATREAISERMVKLIGSGLIPLPDLEPEVTLRFHAACILLHHNPVPANRVLNELRDVLEDMSPHTRRPIRFLEAAATQVMDHGDDSETSSMLALDTETNRMPLQRATTSTIS